MRNQLSILPLIVGLAACSASQPTSPQAPAGGTRDNVRSSLPAEVYGKSAQSTAVAGLATVVWHDGERERTATLDPLLIAEFEPGDSSKERLVALDPGATFDSQPAQAVRLWRVSPGNDIDQLAKSLNSQGKIRFSPVFWDGAVGLSQRMALPGGVLAGFPREWKGSEVEAWAGQQGLELGERISPTSSTWNLRSPAGLQSLELANALRAGGIVRYAHPNWWTEAQTR